jgi:quercetin dioxygenase-like cupin family protein
MASELSAALRDEGLDPSRWSNGPGVRYPVHRHGYDKVIVVERGSIAFTLGDGRVVDLAEGDRLELPAGTDHQAVVGTSGVTCLEAHLAMGTLIGEARRVRAE